MKIKIYTTPTCYYSKQVMEFLKERGVEFQEIDVSTSSAGAKEMVKISGQMGVPVVEKNGKIVVGWNKHVLEDFIKE